MSIRCNGEDAIVDGEQAAKTDLPALKAPSMHESIAAVSMMRKREARQVFEGARNTDEASSSCCNLPYARTCHLQTSLSLLMLNRPLYGRAG
jgi:hypothetical protein